ncbi:PREDICTED: uncharacterized protein LOC108689608 [Atta colombica]|uniref:uncharacterized protein LOC108689608 n=1 Tax=Atta colombica TaxID=520822 RepID=UPI00084CA1E2|nr:PREDICTED: uncharacterized protein LOC108689608 [Atta colombica]
MFLVPSHRGLNGAIRRLTELKRCALLKYRRFQFPAELQATGSATRIASSENNRTNISEALSSFIFASVCIIYMFIANYMGQNIIDHNNHVFITAYNVQWYKTPLYIQRMILFLLQRKAKEFSLNIGGIFNASMEGFATLIKASVSYFTVMQSTR